MKASLIALTAAAALSAAAENFADFALPVVGTDNTKELSNGNLYPCIARPWGAHGWSPQTGDNDTGWFYAYADRRICGIRQTHQPSPWIGDYGQFSLMPAKELDRFDAASRASWFSHKEGKLRQHLLSELKRRYPRCTAQDASFREYGFGATQVTIH